MEKRKNKLLSSLMITALIISNQNSFAGVGDQFNKFIASEFTNISGLYIVIGVLAAGIIGKVLHHFFMKEEGKVPSISKNLHQFRHRHHRPRSIVKKTS